MKHYQQWKRRFFALALCLGLFWVMPPAARAGDSVCAEVKIEIQQELTLERQAFEAHMRINNGISHLTLENISVTVNVLDEEHKPVSATSDPNETNARFFIRIDDMEHITAVDGSGTVAPSTSADIRWLIVPAPGSGSDPPETSQEGDSSSQKGKLYYVGATLSYTIGGEPYVTEVTPDYIYVRPMPQLVLDYFLPQEVYGDDAFTLETEPSIPFSLGVRVSNQGSGTGWELKIDSAQPRIVENKQGLSIEFQILGSTVNGQSVSPSLLADFGNLAPQTAGVARWLMSCSLSGEFSEFTAAFSHADSLGGSLTSLIQEVNTHFLVRDVLVDLPGRDGIQDFLATGRDEPGAAYTLFESDNIEFDVLDLSDTSTLAPEDGSTTRYTLTLPALPASADDVFWYARHAVSETLGALDTVSAVRSDGKQLPADNVWIGKTRNANRGWDYAVHLFDGVGADTAAEFSYTLIFGGTAPEPEALPPLLDAIADLDALEGEALSFTIQAACGDGRDASCIPSLTAEPLPIGAHFIDNLDGTGLFTWTPAMGQIGTFPVTIGASDGELTTSRVVTIAVKSDRVHTLTVVLTGEGRGSVVDGGQIDCGAACVASYPKYTRIYLSAIPEAGFRFAGAEGADCSEDGSCSLALTEDSTITVTFRAIPTPEPTATPEGEPTPTPTPLDPSAVPEPSTVVLIGLLLPVLLALGLRKRRRKP